MLEPTQQSRAPAQQDPAIHAECLGFIRAAIATADRPTARHVAGILKKVCEAGHAERTQIWRDLPNHSKPNTANYWPRRQLCRVLHGGF
ncbi:hypothetical protein QUA41_27660 [Microcoleus sp. Pol11C1]|uniref:hypothetical protein n=1 Tax=unclassified Microcoleus TaxID=2642155 RepID=UPI002FD35130